MIRYSNAMTKDQLRPAILPNYSLSKFAETNLAGPGEWDAFLRVKNATAPTVKVVWEPDPELSEQQSIRHIRDDPNPDYELQNELQQRFVARLRAWLSTGQWAITGIPSGATAREAIALELAAHATAISFLENRIGRISFVEIHSLSVESRFLQLKWAIEQICDVVKAKHKFGRNDVEAIVDRLLPFDVRNDVFKAAWAEADIPMEYRQPGP